MPRKGQHLETQKKTEAREALDVQEQQCTRIEEPEDQRDNPNAFKATSCKMTAS